ncbi:hypothetical protein CASFOL_011561 [Castilleja foliolosa]|uniref:Uncharacterized protein n=1 Tax=Castilleja foliolosa TaxID=1961234 RepID=A0ABD3DX69_9LAMI
MEKRLNHYDKEYLKMAMLKHEETFREQVYELHRLYQIQKMLMKDTAIRSRAEARQCIDLERPVEGFNFPQSADRVRRVSKIEDDDQSDLELTLGPKRYYRKKTKAAEPAFQSDSGLSFSSSSTGSSHIKGITGNDFLSQQKWGPGPEMGISNTNQDRLNSPPWLFQALSLNIT